LSSRGGQTGANMLNAAQFEPVAWWWTQKEIGRDLRERYEVPKELPSNLLALLVKVGAMEGNQLLSYSATPSAREQMVEARIIAGVQASLIGSRSVEPFILAESGARDSA
jgi:hypothetical protein